MLRIVAIISILALTNISFSQEVQKIRKKLSLEEAINIASQKAYEVKAYKNLLKSKEYQLKSVKGLRFPKLTFSETFLRTDNPGYAMMNRLNQKKLDIAESSKYVDMTSFNLAFGTNFPNPYYPEVNNWQTKLQLEIPIFTGFKISTAIKMRQKDYESTKNEFLRKKQEVIYNVIKAYKGAVLAKEGIKTAEKAYTTAKRHYEVAKKMHQTGLGIYADVLRAKVYMMQMENKITQAKANYLTAKKALILAIGENGLKPEDIEIEGTLECKPVEKDVSYFQNIAVRTRQDLLAMRKKLQIAKDMVKMSKSDFFPTVGAFAFYELNSSSSPFDIQGRWWGAGIALNWNVFNGFQQVNKYKSAKETFMQYKHQIKGFEEYIKFKVYEAYNKLLVSYEKYKTQKENLAAIEEILSITEKSYKNQMASMLDLIDTQTLRDKTMFDLNQAKYECEISNLELKYQIGKIR